MKHELKVRALQVCASLGHIMGEWADQDPELSQATCMKCGKMVLIMPGNILGTASLFQCKAAKTKNFSGGMDDAGHGGNVTPSAKRQKTTRLSRPRII